jgi:hypothetical protein
VDSPPTSSNGDGLRDQFLKEGDQVSDQGINYRLPVARHNLVLGGLVSKEIPKGVGEVILLIHLNWHTT